jgi:hypothetical protein
MVVSRKRTSVAQASRNVQQYLHWRGLELEAKRMKDKFRKTGKLDDLVTTSGTRLDNGSFRYALEVPIPGKSGKDIVALVKRRDVSVGLDEEAAVALATELGILDQVTETRVVLNHEAIYLAHQKNQITDKQLDALTVEHESFSLTVEEL